MMIKIGNRFINDSNISLASYSKGELIVWFEFKETAAPLILNGAEAEALNAWLTRASTDVVKEVKR